MDAASELPIENARVELGSGEYSCLTDASGRFSFDHLPPGDHMLSASCLGYRTIAGTHVSITEDVARFLHLRLEPRPVVLPEQRVTGTRHAVSETPRPVAVITAEQIRKAGYRTVVEALASLPGVTVNPGYSSSGTPQLALRGETGKRLAITLDGMPLADGVRGEADPSIVPVSAVQWIEVHRGGDWGDAALGGAVNIVTRKVYPSERSLAAGYGSFDAWDVSTMVSRPLWPAIGCLAAGELTGCGREYTYVNDSGHDTTRANTARRAHRAFAKVGGRVAGEGTWGISGLFYENDRGAPGALHLSTPAAQIRERRRVLAGDLSLAQSNVLSVSVQGSLSDYRTEYDDSLTFPSRSRFDETADQLHVAVSYSPPTLSMLTASLGGELHHRVLHGINYLAPQRSFGRASRTARACWIESRLRSPQSWPSWLGSGQVMGGFRYDRDAQTPPFRAPRIGAVWGWGTKRFLTLSGSWGRSFRRPLLTSLFWKQDVFSSGNPDLEPERSREWDVGIEVVPPRTHLSVSTRFFDRACDGFIEWEKRYGGVWSPVNLPRATVVGREDALCWSAVSGTITVDIFHTLMWAKDHAPDPNYEEKFLLFRPKHSWQAKLEAASHGTDVRFDARWVGRRYTRKQNTKWLPPYRWFDLSLRREFPWRKLRAIISATCENLTNEPAALLEGYPLPGRSARLSLELRL